MVIHDLCNDIFAWACADGEDLPLDEVSNLYRMWEKDSKWGSAKWCCYRRKEKPQGPVVEAMKGDGSWDEEMEKLSENHYDSFCRLHPKTKKVSVGSVDHDPNHKWV